MPPPTPLRTNFPDEPYFYTTIAVLVLTLSAKADVITQNVNFGTVTGSSQLYFNQFNTALGTLTNVSLSWTINSSITTAQITNQNAGTVTLSRIVYSNSFEGFVPSVGPAGDLIADVSKSKSVNLSPSVVLTNGQSYNDTNITFSAFTQADSYTSADINFNSFKGTGSVPLYLANTFGATPTATGSGSTTSWLTTISGSSTGNLVVAYTYTAAPVVPVPEPQSVALGFVGLLFVGGLGMRSFSTKKPSRPLE